LISKLEAAMHTGELHIAAELHESNALREELKDFQRLVSAAGRTTWSARAGKHDDLILSIAISMWHATETPTSSSEPINIELLRFRL
jgi:hypothetical protein